MSKLVIRGGQLHVIIMSAVEYILLSRPIIKSEHKQAESSDKIISFV